MIKKLGLPLFMILFFAITVPSFYLISSQSITITEKKVVYELPYPGILPDNPLYFLKKTRDIIMDFTTRDNLKKAKRYLQISDKDVNAGVLLVKKGKNTLAVDTILEGEQYSVKIPALLKAAKIQGESPDAQFVEKLNLSNNKHREVVQQLLKTIPQGDQKKLQEIFKLNEEVRKNLPH